MTREVFAKALGVLSTTLRAQLDELAFEGYWLVLQHLTPAELQAACLRGMAECEFMPPPAKLLAYVKAARAANAEARAADAQIRRLHAWRDKASLGPIQEEVRKLAEMKSLDESK